MRKFLATLAVCGLVAAGAGSALAATTQQDKMKTCNSEASTKQLSGDARKQFMSSCLSGGGATPAAMSKEQTCTSEATAKKLSGAAKTSFIKKCASS